MKGKVLSIRISEKDIASCVELCNSVNIKPIGMGGYITKTLGILLENLRQSHKIMNMSEGQAREVLEQTFGDRNVGYNCDLPDSFADFSLPNRVEQRYDPTKDRNVLYPEDFQKQPTNGQPDFDTPKVPHVDKVHSFQDCTEVSPQLIPREQDESIRFDQDLEEEIRLSAMLEGENLIDKLLVTEHRSDDKETKLMNPDLAGPVLSETEKTE